MDAVAALEELAPDVGVTDVTVLENSPRHGDRALGIVGGLADSPFPLGIADVARNRRSGQSFESMDSVRIPSKDAVTRQCLGLLSDGITGCDPFQAGEYALLHCSTHVSNANCAVTEPAVACLRGRRGRRTRNMG